ncbi:MAG: hypothetical protein ACKOYM_08280 [Actinomycetes bacterium]
MRGLRRAVVAVAIGGVIAGIVRLRGSDTPAPQQGGWRELEGQDLT